MQYVEARMYEIIVSYAEFFFVTQLCLFLLFTHRIVLNSLCISFCYFLQYMLMSECRYTCAVISSVHYDQRAV